jgi:NodT family efflux transporter outer membrane factor (OMF) lipoprotein
MTAAVLLPGCMTVGPDYEDPELPVPGRWNADGGSRVERDYWTERLEADQLARRTGAELWWRQFGDGTLNALVSGARKSHPTAQAAEARIREAWAQRQVLAAAWSPWVGTRAEVQMGESLPNEIAGIPDSSFSTKYVAGFEAGWDADLFGGVRRGVEAAEAEWQAAVEWQRDAMVVLTAEVALQYVAARTLEERLARARQAAKDFRGLHEILVQRKEEGLAPDVDVVESKAQLLAWEARLPKLEQEMKVARIRLANSSGIYPAELAPLLRKNAGIPVPPEKILLSTPADALRNRPDVRREERKLAAQTARVGLAASELYPKLSVSGALRWESTSASDLFSQANRLFGFGPKLKWRIFEGCKVQRRIDEEEARTDIRLAAYRQQVLDAVTEIEIALTRLDTESRYATKLSTAATTHRESVALIRESYLAGLVDIRRLLNALRDYHDTRDEEAAAFGRRAGFATALFKAIGGGQLPES